MSNTSRGYKKRRQKLQQLGTKLTAQNFVDMKAMALADGKTVGEFLDWLLRREVGRRARKMDDAANKQKAA